MIQPPSVGPRIGATMMPMPNAAMAAPRLATGKLSSMIAWAIGTMAPPPSPCSIRATIRKPRLVAMPQSTDANVNSVTHSRNSRRRPK